VAHENVDIPVVVEGRRQETPSHLSLAFARPSPFDHEAGDWIDHAFDEDLSGGKTYSLTSSPTGPELVITFKEGQSRIKRTLQTADPGDRYRITAYGNDYDFSLRTRGDGCRRANLRPG
jgi:ferredoxin-NADP reductase